MSIFYPQQTIRNWGTYATVSILPGVAAADINLQDGDTAFVDGLMYYCLDASVTPAVWASSPASVVPTACTNAAATTVDDSMTSFDCDDVGGLVTLNLPDASAAPNEDRTWIIYKVPHVAAGVFSFGTAGVSLVPHGTDKINGTNATTAAPGSTAAVQGMWILRRIAASASWLLVG